MTPKRQPDHDPPANIQAEMALLGAVLLANELFEATASLEADDFYLDSHRRIYGHISAMIERGEAVDIVTLAESMRQAKELDLIGESPVAYLLGLSEDTLRYRPAVKDWAKIVKAKSLQRQLISVCTAAINQCYDGESGFMIITQLREHLNDIELAAKRGVRA
jgi:replicative DNA helicase